MHEPSAKPRAAPAESTPPARSPGPQFARREYVDPGLGCMPGTDSYTYDCGVQRPNRRSPIFLL